MRLTIITPCLNRRETIGAAIESAMQPGIDLEHIVIDGGSTDGTLDVLARYLHARVVVEPDGGVYDALNKGLRLATGDIIGLLNSDDTYAPEALGRAAAAFRSHPAIDAVCGGALVSRRGVDGRAHVVASHTDPSSASLSFANILLGAPIINARFFRRTVFAQVGDFDLRFRLAADRDFLLRAALAGLASHQIPEVVYQYLLHPGSLTFDPKWRNTQSLRAEYLAMTEAYLDRRDIPDELRRALVALRSASVLGMCWDAVLRGALAEALSTLRESPVPASTVLATASRRLRVKIRERSGRSRTAPRFRGLD